MEGEELGRAAQVIVCLQHLGSEPGVCNLTLSPLPPIPGT